MPIESIEVTKPPWIFLPLFAIENWVGISAILWISVATGAILLLVLVGLAALAWVTQGAEHIGSLFRIRA
ncbi:MAG: hypothetical protein HY320_10385 [Armatimonadetes bacterium]|nr:hypothetical protein [Armatimonadota bacterium]